MDVQERLSFFAALYRVDENSEQGMMLLYLTIVALCIVVYKLGFAKKLKPLQSLVIYLFLFAGCTVLSFLGIVLPIAEGLVVAAAILVIYKIRLKREQAAAE
ncbi:YlaH-like family protein [Mangrovibacillus cuniculi]|uniref:YlaH-like protein n=1 Tax=Mangrovibacillus cuniculi TaxID=2593652 RepID=A0A7S8HF96_9BACI|nr:YlaH-like family protein [Mangrovibacillus cuniculi]QPC46205.1 hypothetical protein G8O30_04145 [Mangrovibacillus cuniculi]